MRRLLWALLAVAGCGREWGCREGETSYEALEGKVRVELVRHVFWAGGRIPGPLTSFKVRVHTEPPFDEPVSCANVDLAEDEAGKFVAYRCRGTRSWTLLRLLGADRRLRECDAPLGGETQPKFGALKPLSGSLERILDCVVGNADANSLPELVRAVAKDEGSARAVALMATLSERPASERADPWFAALGVLEPVARDQALATLCQNLARADAPPASFARAAQRCSLETPALGDASAAELGRLLAFEPPDDPKSKALVDSMALALRWSSALAVAKKPAAAGAVACAAAGSFSSLRDHYEYGRFQATAAVIAATKTRCPAVKAWADEKTDPEMRPTPGSQLQRLPISPELLCLELIGCGEGRCAFDDPTPTLDAWPKAIAAPIPAGGMRPTPEFPPAPGLLLSALEVQGELPKGAGFPLARARYPLPNLDATRCEDAAAGAPCSCALLPRQLCQFSLEQSHGTLGACEFQLEDEQRRYAYVKAAARERSP